MNLLKIAKPAVTVSSNASVMDAINAMEEATVGAVVVVDEGVIKGMFTERDVMSRGRPEEKRPRARL